MSQEAKPRVYGTTWCGDTKRARRFFDENKIDYEWIDIDQNKEAGKLVEQINGGFRSVPTIIFSDGTTLTEPSTFQLRQKFGIV
jgi:glutaredoxin-like protein